MTDPETYEQVRDRLEAAGPTTSRHIAAELRRQRAKALAEAEEARWEAMEARIAALERFTVDVATHTAPIGSPRSAESARTWAASYGVNLEPSATEAYIWPTMAASALEHLAQHGSLQSIRKAASAELEQRQGTLSPEELADVEEQS